MSETTTETSSEDDQTDAAPIESTPETSTIETQPTETTETPAEPDKPAPRQKDRRFAHLTARIQAETDARDAAERRAAAAEALAEELRRGALDPSRTAPGATQEQIEARARELQTQRDTDARRGVVIAAGRKEFGDDMWNEMTTTLHSLGATGNSDFMAALLEAENAPKIVQQLSDDPDTLVELLGKSPTAMAARIGRMDAKLSQPTATVKPTSDAPRPPAPVRTSSAPTQPTSEQLAKSGSVDDYVAQLKKEFPGSKLFATMR